MFEPLYAVAMLGLESSSVIITRLQKVSTGGGQALDEIKLMFVEKLEAARSASVSLLFGATMNGVVDQYRRAVAANEARLSRWARP